MMGDNLFDYFNGETEDLYYKNFQEQEFPERAIPKRISFSWFNKEKKSCAAEIIFDENEIFKAFSEISLDTQNPVIILKFRVNLANSFVTVLLKGNKKEIPLKNNTIEVY